MIIRRPPEIPSSEITPEDVYVNRRRFIKAAAVGAAGLAVAPFALRGGGGDGVQEIPPRFRTMRSELDEELNEYKDVTQYNNFYEFGTDKKDPHRNSVDFNPRPWKVTIGGAVAKPGDYDLDNPDKWQVASYMWTPGQMVARQGDTLGLHVFVLNGNTHETWIEDPDGNIVSNVVVMNRGREYDFSVSLEKAGVYRLICSTHAPTMTAEIVVLPRPGG